MKKLFIFFLVTGCLLSSSSLFAGIFNGEYQGFMAGSGEVCVRLDKKPVSLDSLSIFWTGHEKCTIYGEDITIQGRQVFFKPSDLDCEIIVPITVTEIEEFFEGTFWKAHGDFGGRKIEPVHNATVIVKSGLFGSGKHPLKSYQREVTFLVRSIADFSQHDTIRVETDMEGLSIVTDRKWESEGISTSNGIWNIPNFHFFSFLENYAKFGKFSLWITGGATDRQYGAAIGALKNSGYPAKRSKTKEGADVLMEINWKERTVVSTTFVD